jgi:hypothetical protein
MAQEDRVKTVDLLQRSVAFESPHQNVQSIYAVRGVRKGYRERG